MSDLTNEQIERARNLLNAAKGATYSGAGEPLEFLNWGDFMLAHGDTLLDMALRLAQAERERDAARTRWDEEVGRFVEMSQKRDMAEARAERLEAALRDALAIMRDKKWARIIGDYYGRGHLSYAGQLDEKFGPIDEALASPRAEARQDG